MPEKIIFILTGTIQSGKTTKLLQWIAGRKDVFGILTPVAEGKRVFMNANTKEQFDMEAGNNDIDPVAIGKYLFSRKSFVRAIEILQKALKNDNGWLVVDEIGPLELRGEGFCEGVNEILSANTGLKILFVIRDSILDGAIQFYQLDQYNISVISIDSFDQEK
ncbi:MAG: nucleoside-triphosphatase [Chitinophagales bacterium]